MTWSVEEKEILRANYATLSAKQITRLLPNRSISGIGIMATHLHLSAPASPIWTKQEDEIVKDNYSKLSMTEIRKLLPNRTHSAIKTRAGHLCITNQRKPLWSYVEDDILKGNYLSINKDKLLALLPNRTWESIKNRSGKLKLRRKRSDLWKKAELTILKNNYSSMPKTELMHLLPWRSWSTIYDRAERCLKMGRSQVIESSVLKKINPLKEWQRGYIAGMIDGEGSISATWQRNTSVFAFEIQVANTFKPGLDAIKEFVGFGIVLEQKVSENSEYYKTRKQAYKYRVYKISEILPLIRATKEYMIIKKTRADLLEMMIEQIIKEKKEFGKRNGYTYSQKVYEIYEELKKLNKKGR